MEPLRGQGGRIGARVAVEDRRVRPWELLSGGEARGVERGQRRDAGVAVLLFLIFFIFPSLVSFFLSSELFPPSSLFL